MKKLLFMALMLLTGTTLNAQTRVGEVYNLPEVTFLNTELDGSITVRSYGEGKRKSDAREQARKNAIYVILFKGIQAKGQTIRPLITEVNAYERHESYFGTFFADGGTYSQYATNEDEKFQSKVKVKGKVQNAYGAVVRVRRSELKAKLIADGIIKN